MLPEIGATEMLVIAAVALIVVGPKDLPLLLRKLGRFVGRLRSMASEFRSSFDEMARQSELDELRREVDAMRRGDPLKAAAGAADVDSVFNDIDLGLREDGGAMSPALTDRATVVPQPAPVEPEPSPTPAKPKRAARAKPPVAASAAKAKPAAKPRASAATPARKRPAARPKNGTAR